MRLFTTKITVISLVFLTCQTIYIAGQSTENHHGELPHQPQTQQGSGFGGLLSGILGTITKTAESTECPGKCIHALASLLCDEVREEISCPQEGLRCCVDRRRPSNRPPPQQQTSQQTSTTSEEQTTEEDPTTTTRKKMKKKKSPTTERTGADIPASMKSNEAQSSTNKADKFGDGDVDYEYTNDGGQQQTSGSDSSTFRIVPFAFAACLAILTGRVNLMLP